MNNSQIRVFRLYFLVGLTIAFVSVFLEWYLFQGVDAKGAVLVDWSYQLLLDWYSPSHLSTELNNWYHPTNASIPLPLVLFFLGLLILASFGALFYSPDKMLIKKKNLKPFTFTNGAVLLIIAFLIVLFPILYLFPNQLLFPMLIFYDYDLEMTYQFSMGIGYWLQLVAFVCCFPYACLCYQIVNNVEVDPNLLYSSIENSSINLDKLIVETELFIAQQTPSPLSKSAKSQSVKEIESLKELDIEEIYRHFINRYHEEGKKE